jgi:hypothetical protein
MSAEADLTVDVDVVRTALQRRYFDTFAFDSPAELLAAVDGMEIDVDSLAHCRDVRVRLADGWVYWLLYTKGLLQYREAGEVSPGNVYFDYLYRHYIAHGHNPAMRRDLEDPAIARERVLRRYRDFDKLSRLAAGDESGIVDPIRVTVSTPQSPHPYLFYAIDVEEPIVVRAIDGWHRMCAARLAGVASLRCEVIHERLDNDALSGTPESIVKLDGAISLTGWWLDPGRPIYNYELRIGGRTVGSGTPIRRPDIAEAFPDVVHAAWSGFHVEAQLPDDLPSGELVLVGLQDIVPVGAFRFGLPNEHAAYEQLMASEAS